LKGRRDERERLALDGRERVRALHLELVAAEVGEDAVTVALEVGDDLDGVVARRHRPLEDRDLLLIRERAVLVLAAVRNGAVDDEERPGEPEGARHLVVEDDLRPRPGNAAREDRVGEQRQAGVASTDLILQLVDSGLEVAEAYRVRGAIHRRLVGDWN